MRKELDLTWRDDRLSQYVKPLLKAFVFGEFSDAFLARESFPAGLAPVMKGVPIPLQQGDLVDFAGSKGLAPDKICENMIRVMACDPHFEYVPAYRQYISSMFSRGGMQQSLLAMCQKELNDEKYLDALLHARGALLLAANAVESQKAGSPSVHAAGEQGAAEMDPQQADRDLCDAVFAYALVTRAMYQDVEGEDTEYVGRCKAESMEMLEILTVDWPDFAPAHYYLGYGYANMGLYRKAQLAWQQYMEIAEAEVESARAAADAAASEAERKAAMQDAPVEEVKEIRGRLEEIADPVIIEDGINDAQAARYDSAIRKLEPYLDGKFAEWWPLHYFLGISYVDTGRLADAMLAFKAVLKLNPSHLETLDELAALYTVQGDEVNAEKFRRKAQIVRAGIDEDTVLN